MTGWKRVFSNCFYVLNPNIKSFLLLVEWNIIKHKTICVFVTWTIICHCCKSRLEISLWYVRAYGLLKESVFQLFLDIKSFFLLVKWKIMKHKIVGVFVTWTIICHCYKMRLEISFWYVRTYGLLKVSVFQLFWCAESKYQIILAFDWVEDHLT